MWLPTDNILSRPPRKAAGLTLIELLITATVFTAVLAAASMLLHFTLRMQQRTDPAATSYEALERTLNRIEHDLESATRLFNVPFDGRADRLEFAQSAASGWVRIVYRLIPEDEGLAVIRETWHVPDDSGEPLQRETLTHLSRGAFTFGILENTAFLWAASWDGQALGVPRLVKLACAMAAEDARGTAFERVIRNPAGVLPETAQP